MVSRTVVLILKPSLRCSTGVYVSKMTSNQRLVVLCISYYMNVGTMLYDLKKKTLPKQVLSIELCNIADNTIINA